MTTPPGVAKIAVSFSCSLTAVLCAASLAFGAPSSLARPAQSATACAGTVKVSFGTFSHIKVSVVTCKYAIGFVKVSGGVPAGWACTSKRAGAITMNTCKNGKKLISYDFT